MINFEEELASFKPSPEVEELETLLSQEPLADLSDLLKKLIATNEKLNEMNGDETL